MPVLLHCQLNASLQATVASHGCDSLAVWLSSLTLDYHRHTSPHKHSLVFSGSHPAATDGAVTV